MRSRTKSRSSEKEDYFNKGVDDYMIEENRETGYFNKRLKTT